MGGRSSGGNRNRNSSTFKNTAFYKGVSEKVVSATNDSKQWLHEQLNGLADSYFPDSLELRQTQDLRSSDIAEAYAKTQKIILYREQDYTMPVAVHETVHIITDNLFNPEDKPWDKGGKVEFDRARREVYKEAGLTPSKSEDKRWLRPYAAKDSSEFWSVLVEEAAKGRTNKLIEAGMSVLRQKLARRKR